MSLDLDLVRARLEAEFPSPSAVAVVSSTIGDGKELAAQSLAASLALSGYRTLYVDAATSGRSTRTIGTVKTFEDAARQAVASLSADGLATLSLADPQFQRASSQRDVRSGLETLRTNFDYIVINLDHGVSTSFTVSVLASADAVIATVRRGRRMNADDGKLAATLDLIGDRFVGVIAIDPATIRSNPVAAVHETAGGRVVKPVSPLVT